MPLDYRYPTPLVAGTLLRRYKRFLADVDLDGTARTVHCANPGSMAGLSTPGMPVRVRDSGDPKRKLPWSLEQVRAGRAWVCVNTALPNRAVAAALARGGVPDLGDYASIRAEVATGAGSRLDFLLEDGARRCWVEVKQVTLRVGTEARFPDAVTTRGLKHLEHLRDLRRAGDRAVMLFFAPRADVRLFRPAYEIDPAYAAGLEGAARDGVEVICLQARVSPRGLHVAGILPYDLSHA